jgi:hypothetical protein
VRKIYIIERSSGSYDDYRTEVMFYTTNKAKAEKFCKEAKIAAEEMELESQDLLDKMQDSTSDEQWLKLSKRRDNLKSKMDPELNIFHSGDVGYYVMEVEELK